jgi:hypothetical protein
MSFIKLINCFEMFFNSTIEALGKKLNVTIHLPSTLFIVLSFITSFWTPSPSNDLSSIFPCVIDHKFHCFRCLSCLRIPCSKLVSNKKMVLAKFVWVVSIITFFDLKYSSYVYDRSSWVFYHFSFTTRVVSYIQLIDSTNNGLLFWIAFVWNLWANKFSRGNFHFIPNNVQKNIECNLLKNIKILFKIIIGVPIIQYEHILEIWLIHF